MNAREKCDVILTTIESIKEEIAEIRFILGDTNNLDPDLDSRGSIECFADQISAIKLEIANLKILTQSLCNYVGGNRPMAAEKSEKYASEINDSSRIDQAHCGKTSMF